MISLHDRLRSELAPQYEVEREIGKGGMGRVFLARDVVLDRPVAIKVLRPDTAGPGAGERLRDEARILARLDHPGIVRVYTAGFAAGSFYYVMDYVEGETLHDRLAHGPLPAHEAMDLTAHLLEALGVAHEHGVVHRDVKPSNVFLVRGRALLTDFGIAKLFGPDQEGRTRLGDQVGSPGHMAPEQVSGEPVTPATDVFTAGMLAYKMLSGRSWSILTAPEDIDWSGVPRRVVPVLRKALENDPQRRWADAQEFGQALDAARQARISPRVRIAAAVAALAVATVLGWVASKESGGIRSMESVAVLPFVNQPPDAGAAYMTQGLADAIATHLARTSSLRVIGRASSVELGQDDLASVGAGLGVGHIVTGTVRREGGRAHVGVQLYVAETGELLWGETFTPDVAVLPSLQGEIAIRIAEELGVVMSDEERARMGRQPTQDLEAYDLYLLGRFNWKRRTPAGFEEAAEYFRQAVERDSTFALAWSGLADTYSTLPIYSDVAELDVYPLAEEAAMRALELDSTLAEAHTSVGQVERVNFDYSDVEARFRRAIELDPNYSTAHQWLCQTLVFTGRAAEGLPNCREAVALDPYSVPVNVTLGTSLYYARRYDEAIEHFGRVIQLDSAFAGGYLFRSQAFLQQSRIDDAIKDLVTAYTFHGLPRDGALAMAEAVAGRAPPETALRVIRMLEGRPDMDRSLLARWSAWFGDSDYAMELLREGYRRRDYRMQSIGVEPMLDGLRDRPEFQEILEQVGVAGVGTQ